MKTSSKRMVQLMAAALAVVGLLALPGVSRAGSTAGWTITGTETWTSASWYDTTVHDTGGDGLLTISSQLMIRDVGDGGTLNQTGGTIDSSGASYGTIIGQVASGTYNMSGNASYIAGTQVVLFGNEYPNQSTVSTWSLTDTASVTMGELMFGQADQPGNSRYLLLSGAATFNATSLAFNNTGTTAGDMNYISFASGSTATFTAGDKTLSDYQALVTAGNIRVDGVATNFGAFQVVGHTLSLSTGAPTPPHLVITDVNGGSNVIAGIGFDVTVEAQDESNTPTNLTADTEVTLALKIGTGTGTLGGTTTGTISNGHSSVTISGVTYTKAETGVVLTASGGGLEGLDSTPFTVVPGAPFQLAFGVQPSDTCAGAAITPAVTVLVQDANGNTVTNDTSSVTISGTTFAGDSTLTTNAVAGVATFSNLKPTMEGSGITLTSSDGSLTVATSSSFIVGGDEVFDWTVTGTVNRSCDRTVDRYFMIGVTETPGTLNQTDGTITGSGSGLLIGQVLFDGVTATYNMSGAARYNSGTGGVLFGNAIASTAVATWSLADTASVTIGELDFGQASQAAGSRYVLLSGAASFTCTSLAFNNTGTTAGDMNYISFASGSTATFTADDKVEADYQALVAAGNIRVDGVAQSDFSAFQVTGVGGHTLSLLLSTPPTASFTALGPTSDWAPLTVTFTNTSTAGSGPIATNYWDFGDGSYFTNTTSANVTNTYASTGTYTVILTISDTNGYVKAATSNDYIMVTARPALTNPVMLSGQNGFYRDPEGHAMVRFTNAQYRVDYTLEYNDDLLLTNNWQPCSLPTNGVGALTLLETNSTAGVTQRFYRIKAQQQPYP